MFDLRGKKGAWLNNYALPDDATFSERASQIDYVIIKYGLAEYEKLASEAGVPWLAEIYPYRPTAQQDGVKLAQQAAQPGCVGAVVNMESGTGPGVANWETDNGSDTQLFTDTFKVHAPGVPLYACIDTRGNRGAFEYQVRLAKACDGVMPMWYPKTFKQSPADALKAVLPTPVRSQWAGKPIIVAAQTYDAIGADAVREQIRVARWCKLDGITAYTLGHASQPEWDAFVKEPFVQTNPVLLTIVPTAMVLPPTPDVAALTALRDLWVKAMTRLAEKGTPAEVQSFLDFWNSMGKGVK